MSTRPDFGGSEGRLRIDDALEKFDGWRAFVSRRRNVTVDDLALLILPVLPRTSQSCERQSSTILKVLDTTETFKLKKQQLMGQGFNPDQIDVPLYFKDPESGAFRLLDAARFSEIVAGKIRFLAIHKGDSWWLPAKNRFNDLAYEINI